jgi:lipoprotein-anchoring transpeptidase ErfK/SrfK
MLISGMVLTLFLSSSYPPTVSAESVEIKAHVEALKQSQQHWIQVDLSEQKLTAWEGKTPVQVTPVSTGKRTSPTPTGIFKIQSKYRLARMQGSDYDVPDVLFTLYYDGNYAIHGAYWHNHFGTRVSHGCVNVPVAQAQKLFQWVEMGTVVVVQD